MEKREKYVVDNFNNAVIAGKRYGINPIFILCDGAIEGAWGTSNSAMNRRNMFGMTASGVTNEHWNGAKSESKNGNGLWFRVYETTQQSFLDFARQIKLKYSNAANQTTIEGFANALASSQYINPASGDDPAKYKSSLISAYKTIVDIAEKKKFPQQQ